VSGRAARVLAVTRVSVRRYARDRRALLFVLILPTMVILILGVTLRGFTTLKVGVVDLGAGQAGQDLNGALEHSPALSVKHYGTLASARRGVARGEVSTAVILPAGMDAALQHGSSVTIEVLADPLNGTEQAAAAAVASVVSEQGSRVQAAVFATAEASGTLQQNLTRATTVQGTLADVGVVASQVQTRQSVLPEGFRYSAPTMLVLFVFLNALAGGAIIVENRRSGMYERMAAAPIRPWTIVEGEALTYVGIAVVQSLLIVGLGAVVFGVSWGDPVAAAALIAVWSVVGAGAGLLSGTLFKTPEQATSIGPALGIALGMLGGCMWPLSIVTGVMRQVGHATPQAWAIDGWTALMARHGALSSIAGDLAVLAAFAAAFLVIASVRLRRVLL